MVGKLQFSPIPNGRGDDLPIIPVTSSVVGGRVLYRKRLVATLTDEAGQPIPGRSLSFRTSCPADSVLSSGSATGSDGTIEIVIETREHGPLTLLELSGGYASYSTSIADAWYEHDFEVTAYNVCDEDDFSGAKVRGNGIDTDCRGDFLYSAYGVCMEGTGRTQDGRYIAYVAGGGGWSRNSRGIPTRIADPRSVLFRYVSSPQGAYAPIQEGISVAVDPVVVPPLAKIWIKGVGERIAHDTGGSIKGDHVDVFRGIGRQVMGGWRNLDGAAVKLVGLAGEAATV